MYVELWVSRSRGFGFRVLYVCMRASIQAGRQACTFVRPYVCTSVCVRLWHTYVGSSKYVFEHVQQVRNSKVTLRTFGAEPFSGRSPGGGVAGLGLRM